MSESRGKTVVVDWTSPEGPAVTHIRGTMILSSLTTLRERGLFERYLKNLDPALHDAIVYDVSTSWRPIEHGVAHYAACDALGLSDEELHEIGEAVSERVMGTFLGTLVRRSRDIGGTPWIVVRSYPTLWSRIWRGGSVRVIQEGPKDAILIGHGCPCGRLRYFDTAYRGVVKGAIGLFARTVYTRTLPRRGDELIVGVRWV